jgi:formylmethanofuran dehydrogenase subunit B
MGTRSVTHIHEMPGLGGKIVCTFYRGMDGYPTGHGQELADWLKGKRLVNGIGANFEKGIDHNRAGQMAIELMHSLKQDTSIEVTPTGQGNKYTDFNYTVAYDSGFKISVESYGTTYGPVSAEEFNGKEVEAFFSDDDD